MNNPIIGICGALLLLFACAPADPPAPAPPTTPLDPVRFTDATATAGIDFQMRSGGQVKNYIVESKGGGGAFFDYNSDGWLDIYLVNGSRLGDQTDPAPANALYRNQGNGTFADHTLAAGVGDTAWGMGCAAGTKSTSVARSALCACRSCSSGAAYWASSMVGWRRAEMIVASRVGSTCFAAAGFATLLARAELWH